VDQGLLTVEASRSHSDTSHSVRLLWTSNQPVAETVTWQHTTLHSQDKDIYVPGGIWTHNPRNRAAADPRCRPRGHWDRLGDLIKGKQSLYRPGQFLRVHGGWGSQRSKQSVHEGGRWSNLRIDRLGNFIVEYNQVLKRQAAGLYWSCLVSYVSFLLVRYIYQICNSGAYDVIFLALLGAFAKLRRAPLSFVMSVRPSDSLHVSARFPLDVFQWNLTL